MAILLFPLMVLLASVEAFHRPFTAFHREQVGAVHGQRPGVGGSEIQPINQRLQPTYQRLQASAQLFPQPAFYQFRKNSVFSQFFSGDLVEQTRAQADSTKS